MGDVRVQVRLEGLEVGPCPSPEELVLHVAEDLLGGAVVDAVALSGHALDDHGVPQPPAPCGVLVLPAHVAVKHRRRALGHLRQQQAEQLGLLRHVRAGRRRPRDYLLAAEVVHRREVGLAPGLLELGDVGAHLLPGPVGGEVAPDDVLERLAHDAPLRVVPMVVGLAADAAADPHFPYHLEHGLVGYARAQLGTQAHGDLAVAAPVGRAREDLRHRAPQLRARRPRRVRSRDLGPNPLGLPLGLGLSASAPPSRYSAHHFLSGDIDIMPNAAIASVFVMPPSTTAEAAATFCSYVYLPCFPSMRSSTSLPNARISPSIFSRLPREAKGRSRQIYTRARARGALWPPSWPRHHASLSSQRA